jgi:hypothetical protein
VIVCVSYQFHDNERGIFILDTSKLRAGHRFESDVKNALESGEDHVTLDGNIYEDDWGNFKYGAPSGATVKLPCVVEAAVNLDVLFE